MSVLNDHVPGWLRSIAVDESTLTVEGKELPYVIIRQPPEGMAPPYCVGQEKVSGIYFVSEDTPKQYRDHVLRHEMYEYDILGNCPGACRMATHYELAGVPFSEWRSYAYWRRSVLESLQRWMRAHPKEYSREQCVDAGYGQYQMHRCTTASS